MFIHFHSLYAGIVVYAVLLMLGASIITGLLGVVACLAMDYQKLMLQVKNKDRAGAYAAASVLQASMLFLVFVALQFIFYGYT